MSAQYSEPQVPLSMYNNAGQSFYWVHVPLVRVNSATAVTFRAIVGAVLLLGERSYPITI